jgi:antitoxin component of MazEF toxin-antitoxin module
MASTIELECHWPSTLEKQEYIFNEETDKSRNALVVPKSVLDDIGISEYGYVKLSVANKSSVQDVILPALSFEETPDEDPPRKASLRTNLMDQLPGQQPEDTLKVEAYSVLSSDALPAYLGYADDIYEYDYCYLSESVRETVGAAVGDYVEAYNPEHGGRMALRVRALRTTDNADKIRMSGQARDVLQIDIGDEVRVRETVHAQPTQLRWWERALSPLVGFRQLGLQVRRGSDRDEHRNVVRISEDVMELLAVDQGDQIVLEWNGTSISVRCLPPRDDDLESMEIKVPSTVRDMDQFDVSIHDAVHVRRNPYYILRKQVAVSTLGILGVIVGSFQVASYLNLAITTAILQSIIMSIFVIWLLLLPERQRCARGD